MTACVLGVMAWKALDAKKAALASGSADIQNLAHSLAEHASHTLQAVDIAMAGMVDLLKYRDPEPDRFNKYLAETAKTLPQLRGIGVADAKGNWRYSSFPETPRHNVSDRSYFAYHRDTPDNTLRISELMQSRMDDQASMIVLSKRITRLDGSFGGVVAAAVDKDYFNGFYRTFQLGPDAVRQGHRSFQDRPVLKAPQAELCRILQDRLPVRRHREIFRLRGNAALSGSRHRGRIGRRAAFRVAEGIAD
jgi:hypothetical protein